jgi:hypothetical protein
MTVGAGRVHGSAVFRAGAIIRAWPLMGALCFTAIPDALPAAGNPRPEPLRLAGSDRMAPLEFQADGTECDGSGAP